MRRQRGHRVLRGKPEQDAALHMADAVADMRAVFHRRLRAAKQVPLGGAARDMLRLHAPETLNERTALRARFRQHRIGNGQHFFFIGPQRVADVRHRVVTTAAMRHRMQLHTLGRLQHHERSGAGAHQTRRVADFDCAHPLPPCCALHKAVHCAAPGEPPAARRATELQVHGHRRQPRMRRQTCAHRSRHHQIGEDRKTRQIQLTIGFRAMRQDIHRQRGVIRADMVVRQIQKIAGKVVTGLAVQGDAAQHLRADCFQGDSQWHRQPGSDRFVHQLIVASGCSTPAAGPPSEDIL